MIMGPKNFSNSRCNSRTYYGETIKNDDIEETNDKEINVLKLLSKRVLSLYKRPRYIMVQGAKNFHSLYVHYETNEQICIQRRLGASDLSGVFHDTLWRIPSVHVFSSSSILITSFALSSAIDSSSSLLAGEEISLSDGLGTKILLLLFLGKLTKWIESIADLKELGGLV